MSQNKNFSRYFIILQEQDKGYGLTPNKVPTGYAKVECKNNKCKITFYVQNLKKENVAYYMFLIASKKNTEKLINLGSIKLDNTGRAEVTSEHDQENISGTNISFDKISGAALVVMNGNQVIAPLVGFNTVDIPDFKNFKILNMNLNDNSNQEKQNNKEIKDKKKDKMNYEKYENEIENNKKSDEHKMDDEKLEKYKMDDEKLEELKRTEKKPQLEDTNIGCNIKEEEHDIDNMEVQDNVIVDDQNNLLEDQYNTKKDQDNMIKDQYDIVNEDISKIDEYDNYLGECDNEYMNRFDEYDVSKENDAFDDISEYLDFSMEINEDDDLVRSTIKNEALEFEDGIGEDEYIPFNYEHEDLRNDSSFEKIEDDDSTGSASNFFKDALKDFDKIKKFAPEIKNTKWYRINVDDLDSILNDEDHNKYTVAYYPMINYYPYFSKYRHYIIGLKHDENKKMKYLIYGVPGLKDRYSQPLDGKTGFVIWIPISENRDEDMGYWLLFYDFKNSTILIPEKYNDKDKETKQE